MGSNILDKISEFDGITIQCHDTPDPDAIASGWALYLYLQSLGKDVHMIYGGPEPMKKRNLLDLVKICNVPISYIGNGQGFELKKDSLLLVVDGQYHATNVTYIEAEHVAIIDHHIPMVAESELVLIRNNYQSCATIVWELLCEKGFPIKDNRELVIALSYGLYTDTSAYADLLNGQDIRMKTELNCDEPELEALKKSNMNMSELMIAADAIYNHYLDFGRRYAIVSALKCGQAILGIIGDLVIQVDVIDMVLTYTNSDAGYQFSIRSCKSQYNARNIAVAIAAGLGGGGGHDRKAGGAIAWEKLSALYPDTDVLTVFQDRINEFIDQSIEQEQN